MALENTESKAFPSYLNPVYPHPCADPFVLKWRGEYWCYSTGFWRDGRCFGILHSRDLVDWREVGGAMAPLSDESTCYWAPEVTYSNGQFYLYYSVGNEERMQIRVAVADHPAGPFIDSRRRLTTEDFAIDPHVFQDDDGQTYLFYATDFLEHSHIGTGTVFDRMLDWYTLAGNPRPVTRAKYDWQVYDPHRIKKGGVRWHTVEGPFVLKHKGIYYEMFSGGNWQNITYGVSYATTDDLQRPDEWKQASDGESVLPILRTIPGKVIGPGHNSVIRGPDNQQLFCIYHRWTEDNGARVLAIDRQEWAGDRLIILGPSTTAQRPPIQPTFGDDFDEEQSNGLGEGWQCSGGHWRVREGAAHQQANDSLARARCEIDSSHFVLEVSLRSLAAQSEGAFGLVIRGDQEEACRWMLVPAENRAVISWQSEAGWITEQFALPDDFRPDAYHLLRVEANGQMVNITLDQAVRRWQGRIAVVPKGVELMTQSMAAAFAGFAMTVGWQDLFTERNLDPVGLGWQSLQGDGGWYIENQQLCFSNRRRPSEPDTLRPIKNDLAVVEQSGILAKGPFIKDYELVVNARLGQPALEESAYGFYPAMGGGDSGPLFRIEREMADWLLVCQHDSGVNKFRLPSEFDPGTHQQFRFWKQNGQLAIQYQAQVLGQIAVRPEPTRVGLYAAGASVAFDLVRLTAIADNM
jgi:GH43 family beta-xylosidase